VDTHTVQTPYLPYLHYRLLKYNLHNIHSPAQSQLPALAGALPEMRKESVHI